MTSARLERWLATDESPEEAALFSDNSSSEASYESASTVVGAEQRLAAMRGESIPADLDDAMSRAAVIRGIRTNLDFATSTAVAPLCALYADIARARNARLIMSNVIPANDAMSGVVGHDQETAKASTTPYCIWYPDMPAQDTFRELVRRFPAMRYQVGRACAAAGRAELYFELDLLPDVSIAEEARESKTEGGTAIYESIMASPVRYAVMDDFTLTINMDKPRCPAFLNGDTDVLWKMQDRRELDDELIYYEQTRPCIEEDERLTCESDEAGYNLHQLTPDEVKLMHEPLPPDLPTVHKNLLIQMAAYEGNMDRYVRLARPQPMSYPEYLCVVRGIYHHTMFARFWLSEFERKTPRTQMFYKPICRDNIRRAVSARRIMVNDFEEFDKGWPPDVPMPWMIWYPRRPHRSTLWHLADKVPEMREQVAIASIICDYDDVYKSLHIDPTDLMLQASRISPNPFFREDIEARAAERGIFIREPTMMGWCGQEDSVELDPEPTVWDLDGHLFDCVEYNTEEFHCYPWDGVVGKLFRGARVERHVWVPLDRLRYYFPESAEKSQDGAHWALVTEEQNTAS